MNLDWKNETYAADVTVNDIYEPFPSNEVRYILELVNVAFLSFGISIFGVVANTINLIVFIKQGLGSSLNVALAGLAISDLCSLTTLLLFVIWLSPVLTVCDVPIKPSEAQHLTAGLPHGCFTRITSWITAYITAERCLCVTFPLKVKQILNPRRTTLILCLASTSVIVALLPEYISLYLDWTWDSRSNRTLLSLVSRYVDLHLDGITFLLYSLHMFASFIIVTVLTLVLVINLRLSSKWRQSATMSTDQSQRILHREQKAVKVTLALACLLILTFCPTIIATTCGFLVPGFSVTGRYTNLFFLSWSFVQVFDSTNASLNIFLYYKLSVKYRQTFHQLFPYCYTPLVIQTKQPHSNSV